MLLKNKKIPAASENGVSLTSSGPGSPIINDVAGNVEIIYRYGEKEEPRIRNVSPHARQGNLKFAGREAKLKEITDIFSQHNSMSITQTVKGLGGIGKTMLAREYALRFGRGYPKATIYWFNCENSEEIKRSVERFFLAARWTQTREGVSLSDELQAWYDTHSGFLFIFDNVESFDDIKNYLPNNGLQCGYALLTTRCGDDNFPNLRNLDVFSPEDARECLRNIFSRQLPDTEADALCVRLGHFPLALSQAAAYIRQENFTIPSYLELIGDSAPRFKKDSNDEYKHLVKETWALTFRRLIQRPLDVKVSLDAYKMLQLCAYLSADNLPVREYAVSPFNYIFATESEFDQALEKLRNYSLIDDNNGIHRLMQEIICEENKDGRLMQEILREENKKSEENTEGSLLARAIGMMKDALLRAMEDDDLFIELSPHASAAAYHTLKHVFPNGEAPLDLNELSSTSAYDDRSKVDGNFKWTLLWIVAQLEKMLDVKNGAYQKLFGCEMLRNEDGSIRLFGGFEWEVLKYSEDRKRALIVTREIVGRRPYDGVTEEEWDDDSYKGVTWEECSLRAWLNSGKTPQRKDGRTFDYTSEDPNDEERSGFLNRFFSADERAKIADVNLPNPSMIYTALDGSPRDPTPGGEETRDKVFLFSIDELLDVFGVRRGENEDVIEAVKRCESDIRVIDTDPKWFTEYKESWDSWLQKQTLWSEKLIAIEDVKGSDKSNKNDEKNTWWWWLRSPGHTPDNAAYVDFDGGVSLDGRGVFRGEGGVRPALWLNL